MTTLEVNAVSTAALQGGFAVLVRLQYLDCYTSSCRPAEANRDVTRKHFRERSIAFHAGLVRAHALARHPDAEWRVDLPRRQR